MHWTLIPSKPFTQAKSRLSPVLSPRQRAELAEAMLLRTIATVRAADADAGIMVISCPGVANRVAEAPGLDRLVIATAEGLNAQLAQGAAEVPDGATILVLPADLVFLEPADVMAMLTADVPVALAADQRGAGTNALLLRSGIRFFHFGTDSFSRHRAAARRHGVTALPINRVGLSFDLDEPTDWREFLRLAPQDFAAPGLDLAAPGVQ